MAKFAELKARPRDAPCTPLWMRLSAASLTRMCALCACASCICSCAGVWAAGVVHGQAARQAGVQGPRAHAAPAPRVTTMEAAVRLEAAARIVCVLDRPPRVWWPALAVCASRSLIRVAGMRAQPRAASKDSTAAPPLVFLALRVTKRAAASGARVHARHTRRFVRTLGALQRWWRVPFTPTRGAAAAACQRGNGRRRRFHGGRLPPWRQLVAGGAQRALGAHAATCAALGCRETLSRVRLATVCAHAFLRRSRRRSWRRRAS
jgi:hypothetical protein